MKKLEAIKYFCENYRGAQGGYSYAVLSDLVLEEKKIYTKEELDALLKKTKEF